MKTKLATSLLAGLLVSAIPAGAACMIPPSGLTSWWRGENTAADDRANNPGSLQGGLGFATGRVGQAFDFTANGQGVFVPASATLNVGTNAEFTLEAWINPADVANQYPIAEWNNGDIGAHLWISVSFVGMGGPGAVYASIDNNPANVLASAPGLLTAGAWQHIAMTYRVRFGFDEVKLFLNGAEVASKAIASTTPRTSYPLHIGQRPGLTSFRGRIDEVSLYQRALSAAEIQALHQAGSEGKCAGFFLTDPQRSGQTTTFRYPTRRDSYYIHYFGLDVANVTEPFELRLGDGAQTTVSFASESDRGFFRVQEVALTRPLDVDQDGIDDAYELRHPTILNPLVAGDARQDPDADGDSNLYEYVCRSDPTNHFNTPFPLSWSRVNSLGILKDAGQDAWHAGRVVDVIAQTSSGVLAATEHGGVWSVTHGGFAIPLSDSWDKPDMNSLAAGPDGPAHFFAAGVGLYETDVTHAFPIFNWREIRHPLARVIKLVVLPASRRIVLAGEGGVFWAPIPSPGSPPSSYVWRAAQGLPAATRYSGAAEGPEESVVVARNPDDTAGARLFRGTWSGGNLVFSPATINGVDQTGMYRTSLASCAGDRRFMYAISADYTNDVDQGYVYAILRSTDGGQTWSPCGRVFEGAPAGYEFRFVPGNQGNTRNQCIAVSPTDPNRVAFGWRRGPFVSVNGGNTWRADAMVWNPANPSNPSLRTPHQHGDLAAVYFDPYDASQNSLFVGSDGGLIRTPDLGSTFDSGYNRNLANLDFVNPSGERSRYWYGSLGVSLQGNDLVIGSGSQDNGNLYCYFDAGSGTPSPWLHLGGGDGNLFTFLETGDLLSWHNSDANVRWARWNTGANAFTAAGYVDVMPSYPSPAGAFHLDLAVIEAVELPSQQNSFGQLLYAVAGRAEKLYAFYADANGANCHWTPVGTLATNGGEYISGIGSFDGHRVFIGTSQGRLFRLDMSNLAITPATFATARFADSKAHKFAFLGPTTAFVCMANSTESGATVFRTTDGATWSEIMHGFEPGLPRQNYYSIATDWTTTPGQVFLAADNEVFVSFDAGARWRTASAGLPRRPHSSDLRLANDLAGKRHLYLSTLGHSVWRAQLADYSKYPIAARGTSFSGNYLQSTWGDAGNYELLVPRGQFVFHYSRHNDEGGFPWRLTSCLRPYQPQFVFESANPGAVALIQSRLGNAGYPGTLEAVVRMDPIFDPGGTNKWLAHYYFDSVSRRWQGPFPLSADGQPIVGVTGDPALIQSTFGSAGNYELLVPMNGVIAHFWRDNSAPGYPWHRAPDMAVPIGGGQIERVFPTEVAFLQGNLGAPGFPGNFEAVVRMTPILDPGGTNSYLAHYWFDTATMGWNGPSAIIADGQEITGVSGPPAMIQSSFGNAGNLEVLVPLGRRVAHLWRDNDAPGLPWHRAADVANFASSGGGDGVFLPGSTPKGVGFFQANFVPPGGSVGVFEAAIWLSSFSLAEGQRDYLVTYYFDTVARQWFSSGRLIENGQDVEGVTGF